MNKFLVTIIGFLFTAPVFAAGGPGAHFINYYQIILDIFGVHSNGETYKLFKILSPAIASMFIFMTLLAVGILYRKAVQAKLSKNDYAPSKTFGLTTFIEAILEFIINLADDIIGKKESAAHYSLLCALFLFIFFSNLSGLIPGFPPATENFSVNLGMGLLVFLHYNIAGFKEHGPSYMKHFLGPVWWLVILMLPIELVSHLARPVSLSLRLYGNITGDHMVMSVFTSLSYVILPALLLFFGLLVATIQSFVFTLLSSIYISMAVSHDH